MKKVALYMRYSSQSQTEQSIEGQDADLTAYCERNGYEIVEKYIDRATSASKNINRRHQFLRMISESGTGKFEAIIIWSFDRFARSRKDSALYRSKLKANGIELISIKEDIPDTPVGIIMEGLFDAMAEYYSAELSVKVKRGIKQSASKHKALGGTPMLGLKTDKEKNIVIDEEKAPIVRDIFEMYAEGVAAIDICRYLTELKVLTIHGNPFSVTALKRMLTNEKYIGTYTYQGERTENAIPAIINRNTWSRVQMRLKNIQCSGTDNDYLLSNKIYCSCGGKMQGYGGTSRTAEKYRYYSCENHKNKKKNPNYCPMMPIRKEPFEKEIIAQTVKFFSQIDCEKLAEDIYSKVRKNLSEDTYKGIQDEVKETERIIQNLVNSLAVTGPSEALTKKLKESEERLKELQTKYNAIVSSIPEKKDIFNYIYKYTHYISLEEDEKISACKNAIESVTVKEEGEKIITTVRYKVFPQEGLVLTMCREDGRKKASKPDTVGFEGSFECSMSGADEIKKLEPLPYLTMSFSYFR